MKYLIKFFAILGLMSMSHVAVAIDNVSDGDVLTADTMNEIIDATNTNSASGGFDFDITNPCNGGTRYYVGDPGPSGDPGSLVFFVTADRCNGLEAASVDQISLVSENWGCLGEDVRGADGTNIGTGAPNNNDVEDNPCTTSADAVVAARAYNGGTLNDWYLPSRDELLEMYNTVGPGGTDTLGGLVPNGVYWSSSEVGLDDVYVVRFEDGTTPTNPKNFQRKTRAIRTFTQP